MTKNHIDFALPSIGEEEIAAVVECLRSGWITTGPRAKVFEADFARFVGSPHAVSVNSATAGLHLALEAVGVGPGDEVITTTYTFSASAMVAVHLGAKPVLVDVDPKTLNIDPERIKKAITSRTKAIVPVHIAGLACDVESISRIAREHNLKVVEDAAHALPTSHDGTMIGSGTADATVFSFYANKTITTGEGGMVVTRDAVVAERCRVMRLHGIDRDALERYRRIDASWYYEIVAPGYKYNLGDIAAAIGIEQLKKAYAFHARRQEIAERYNIGLGGLPVILPAAAPEGDLHAWHLYIIRLDVGARIDRDSFVQEMAKKGVHCSVHYIPLHLHPYWRTSLELSENEFPNATKAYRAAVTLPLHARMTDDQVNYVVETVRTLLR